MWNNLTSDTGRGSPVILLNHVFWGKIDHRTMNDDE